MKYGFVKLSEILWNLLKLCETLLAKFQWNFMSFRNSWNFASLRHRHWVIPMTSPSFIITVMLSISHHCLIFRGDPPNIKPLWMTDDITMMMHEGDVIGITQCLYLPKAELNTKNSTRRRPKASSGWVFGLQLDSIKKSNGHFWVLFISILITTNW